MSNSNREPLQALPSMDDDTNRLWPRADPDSALHGDAPFSLVASRHKE